MYITYSVIFLLLLAVLIITVTLTQQKDPKFDSERSENFNNVVHYEGVYKNKELKIAPEFEWVEYKEERYEQKTTTTYSNDKNTLYFGKHPFYYINQPVLTNQVRKEHNIPKIIWQTMKQEPVKGTMVYDAVQTFKNQEGWEYRFMTDEKAKVFLKENFDEDVLHAFEVIVPGAFKADLLRACLLYIHGGVYADSKLFLHYNLDSFLDNDLVLVNEFDRACGIWNGFMASVPKNEYFKMVVDRIVENVSMKYYGENSLDICGPRLYGRVYLEHTNSDDIKVSLSCNSVNNDTKNYISMFKNQEIFISWDTNRKYRKHFGTPDYSHSWHRREVYDLKLHSTSFNILSGRLEHFNKTETTLDFLWSKGLRHKDKYSLEPTETHSSGFNINRDIIWVRMGSKGKNSDIVKFSSILEKLSSPKILVTSDGDLSIPSGLDKTVFNKIVNNNYIEYWYTQNYDGTVKHPKLKPYPIGLDLHTPKSGLMSPIKRINTLLKIRNQNKNKVNKVFCDLHLSQNAKFNNERKRIRNILKNKNYIDFLNTRVSQEKIWENYSSYDYTISTHGNGLDCHRTWEIILLGGIVITKTSSLDPLFRNLPVVIVKDWDECTDENLSLWKHKFKDIMNDEHIFKFFTYEHWLS